jgi:hypothetical protein
LTFLAFARCTADPTSRRRSASKGTRATTSSRSRRVWSSPISATRPERPARRAGRRGDHDPPGRSWHTAGGEPR